jgi:hypothetical protein
VQVGINDPDSAKFREVSEKNGVICGQINGKNAAGAYSGFVPFVAKPIEEKMIAEVYGQNDDLTK